MAQEAAAHLGRAVAGLLNLLNPSLVIVGGDLARLGDLLLDPLRETVKSRTLVSSVAAAEIRASELGTPVGGHRCGHADPEGRARATRGFFPAVAASTDAPAEDPAN